MQLETVKIQRLEGSCCVWGLGDWVRKKLHTHRFYLDKYFTTNRQIPSSSSYSSPPLPKCDYVHKNTLLMINIFGSQNVAPWWSVIQYAVANWTWRCRWWWRWWVAVNRCRSVVIIIIIIKLDTTVNVHFGGLFECGDCLLFVQPNYEVLPDGASVRALKRHKHNVKRL